MKRLSVRKSDTEVCDVTIAADPFTVGRSPDSDLQLDDSQVSWHHAVVDAAGNKLVLKDLDSTNGTFVGKRRVNEVTLSDGDVFRIGPFHLRVQSASRPLSAASSSEETLFLDLRSHAHRIDAAHDPYATIVPPARMRDRLRRSNRSSSATATLRAPKLTADRMLNWLRPYQRANLRDDAIAGLTIAALLIPQGMAYALLAGLPPVMGLYSSMLPLLLYALAGTSRQTSVGPVALDAILIAVGLAALADGDSQRYIALAIALAAVIGVLQIAMGALRLGFLVNFLSYPVLSGLTAGAAIIIALSQIQHILGLASPPDPSLPTVVTHLWHALPETSLLAVAIGFGGTALLLLQRRFLRRWPGALMVLVAATVLTALLGLDSHGLATVGPVAEGLPSLAIPMPDWQDLTDVLPLGITMALVGFAQTIAVGKSLGNRAGYDIDANKELLALGLANLGASASQGFAVSASFSRSAANAEAGARTPLAGIVTAVIVLIVVVFLTPLIERLPKAALASIVLISAIGLIDLRVVQYLFRVKQTEGMLLAFTFAATLVFGIIEGLAAGVVASILLFVSLNTRPNAAMLGRLPGTNIFRNAENFPEAETIPGLAILRIDASFYFANTEFLKKKLREVAHAQETPLKALILDASAVNDLDSSADTALHQMCDELRRENIDCYIAGVKAPVREVMRRSGLYEKLGGDHFFFTIDAAVKRFLERYGDVSSGGNRT